MSLLDSIHVFVGVPLTQNCPPLGMDWSNGVYYHAYVFNVYMDNVSLQLHKHPIGCSVGGTVVNHMLYADDIGFFALSAKGLQNLLDLSHTYGCNHSIAFNPSKSSVIIISCPQRRSSIAQLDPPFLRCRLCLVSPRNVYSSSWYMVQIACGCAAHTVFVLTVAPQMFRCRDGSLSRAHSVGRPTLTPEKLVMRANYDNRWENVECCYLFLISWTYYPDSKKRSVRCRPDIGKCRPRHRPDVGNYIGPISANVGWYRADSMFARGLSVGQMSSTISGRHLADIDSMSGRCLKTIEARCRPDIGKCRPRHRLDVGKIYRVDIGKCRLISGRLHFCTWARCRPDVVNDIRPTSGRYRLDVGPMSENHRGSMSARYRHMSATSGWCRQNISGRYRQMSADIGPTPCLHVGSLSARCRQRYQADIWPI